MAKYIHQQYINKKLKRIADFFCGCGVIGLECILNGMEVEEIYFVEKNIKFLPHIEKNIKGSFLKASSVATTVLNYDIRILKPTKFDLILANPPYFYPSKNRTPNDEDRESARFYTDISFIEVIEVILKHLSEHGKAFVLYRKDQIEAEKKIVEDITDSMSRDLIWEDHFYMGVGLLMVF